MIMTWRDRERYLNLVFCDDSKVVDDKERDGVEDEYDVEDTCRYEKSGEQFAGLGWDDLVSVKLHAGWGVVPAVSGMVN